MKPDDTSTPPRRPDSRSGAIPPAAPPAPTSGDAEEAPLASSTDLAPDHDKPQELQIHPLPKVEPPGGPSAPEPDHDHDRPPPAPGQA